MRWLSSPRGESLLKHFRTSSFLARRQFLQSQFFNEFTGIYTDVNNFSE